MLKILYFLLLEIPFVYALIAWHDEMGNYIYLVIAFILFLAYEFIHAIYQWLDDKF